MNILEQASFQKDDVQVISEQTLYSGFLQVKRLHLQHAAFQHSEQITVQRELIQRPKAVGALLYDHNQERFALIEQFRVGAINDEHSAWQLEIIAGIQDTNESAEECIRRECLEESGCTIQNLTHLFTFYPSAGACSEIFDLYAAECDLPQHSGQIFGVPSEGENIMLHIFHYQVLDDLLASNRLRNAPVIIALQWLKQQISLKRDS